MIERGILPADTDLTQMNPMPDGTFTQTDLVRPWAELTDEEKAMFCRMAEVFAGFSEYTDAQVGRIVDYLEESGQLENTLILYCADNGASGEGSPNGSVNEGKIFGGYPDDEAQNLTMVDKLGSPDTYNHYPTGWAMAFSTPYRMFKRYTYQGGVCDPLVIHWPAGYRSEGRGALAVPPLHRHRADDPRGVRGRDARRLRGRRADAAVRRLDGLHVRRGDGPTEKKTQYYEMLGSRGIWHEGWKAVAEHGPMSGIERLRQDDAGSCSTRMSTAPRRMTSPPSTPTRSRSSKALWLEEAKANDVLPLNDLQIIGNPKDFETFVAMEFHQPAPPSGQFVVLPRHLARCPERSAANVHNVSYKMLAEVDLTPDTEGIIFAHGSRFGGHALFLKDGTITYAYNFLGIPPEDRIQAPAPTSGKHIIGVEFTKERMGEYREGIGPLKLFIDDQQVGRAGDPHRHGPLLPVRRGPLHRLRLGRRRLEHVCGLEVRVRRTARS